jgi:hypothetical protein
LPGREVTVVGGRQGGRSPGTKALELGTHANQGGGSTYKSGASSSVGRWPSERDSGGEGGARAPAISSGALGELSFEKVRRKEEKIK